jgi:hypothetical protein
MRITGRPPDRPARDRLRPGPRRAVRALLALLVLILTGAAVAPATTAADGPPPPAASDAVTPGTTSDAVPAADPPGPAAGQPSSSPRLAGTSTADAPAPAGDATVAATTPAADTPTTATDPGPAAPPATAAPAPASPANAPTPAVAASAANVSTVIQAIFQVQQGCSTYCTGTTLTQTAAQLSATAQTAVATAIATPTGTTGTAGAANLTRTIQIVAQEQFGCVAFCFDTLQTQTADQRTQVIQTALATGSQAAVAQDIADGSQFVLQVQEGCTVACDGASVSSTSSQSSILTQLAGAGAGGVTVDASPVSVGGTSTSAAQAGFATPDAFFAWVAALASDLAATVQTSVEVQVAACLSHCTGGVQSQTAAQRADVVQVSVAAAGPPLPVSAPRSPGASAPAAAVAPATPAAVAAPAPPASPRGLKPSRTHARRTHGATRRARHATRRTHRAIVLRHRPRARHMCLRLTLYARVPKASGPRLLRHVRDLHFAQRFSCDHRSVGR